MFQCKTISRRRWKSSFIQFTRKRAEDCKTDPKLVHILLAGIRLYFNFCSPPQSEFANYPPVYRQLAINQTTIGWGHLIRGRIISSWETIQQDYIYRIHPSTKFEPDAWHGKLLHPMLIDCHTLWTIRNGERHGTNKKTQCISRLVQLERDLITIYKLEPDVLASYKDLFDTPIDELLTLSLDEIEKWITSRRPIILQSRRKARRHSTSNIQLLPTYFHPLQQSKPNRLFRPPIPQSNPAPTANTLITSYMPRIPTNPIRRQIPARPSMNPRCLLQAAFEFYEFPP
jgi:hypothetical protein